MQRDSFFWGRGNLGGSRLTLDWSEIIAPLFTNSPFFCVCQTEGLDSPIVPARGERSSYRIKSIYIYIYRSVKEIERG